MTEIGGWVDRLDRSGRLVWSVADALHLSLRRAAPSERPHPRLRVHDPGPRGRDDAGGPDRLVLRRHEWQEPARPPLARDQASQRARCRERRLAPPGRSGRPTDEPHRVAVRTHRRRSRPRRATSTSPTEWTSCPAGATVHATVVGRPVRRLRGQARDHRPRGRTVTRIGSLPSPTSRLAAVALPDGRVLVLGGLVAGVSSSQILAGTPGHLVRIGVASVPDARRGRGPARTRRGDAVRGWRVGLLSLPSSVSILRRAGPTTPTARRATLGPRRRRCPWTDVSRGWLHRSPLRERSPSCRRQGPNACRCASSGRDSVRGGCGSRRSDLRRGRRHRVRSLRRRVPGRCALRASLASSDTPSADRPCAAGRGVGCALAVGGDGSRSVFRIDLPSGRVSVAARLPRVLANAAAVTMSRRPCRRARRRWKRRRPRLRADSLTTSPSAAGARGRPDVSHDVRRG